METLKILLGDFRPGRAEVLDAGLRMSGPIMRREFIPFSTISSIKPLRSERLKLPEDQVKTAALGGVVGGIATGALAGGLTGRAGAVLGAVAGAFLAAARDFTTCRVVLADGRQFTAVARTSLWAALEDARRRPPLQEVIVPEGAAIDRSRRLLSDVRDRVVAVAGRFPGRKN